MERLEVVGLTVLALSPSGAGGTVVVVPAGSVAAVDGIDHPDLPAVAFGQGGMDAEVTATEGMLGVTFSATEQVDEAGDAGPVRAARTDPRRPRRRG